MLWKLVFRAVSAEQPAIQSYKYEFSAQESNLISTTNKDLFYTTRSIQYPKRLPQYHSTQDYTNPQLHPDHPKCLDIRNDLQCSPGTQPRWLGPRDDSPSPSGTSGEASQAKWGPRTTTGMWLLHTMHHTLSIGQQRARGRPRITGCSSSTLSHAHCLLYSS